jgi:integrase
MPTNPRLKFKNNMCKDPATGLWHIHKKIHGHTTQRAFPTKRAATLFLEHLVLEAAGVQIVGPAPTLAEARDAYIANRTLLGRSPRTIDMYHQKTAALIKGLGDKRLDRIDQRAIESYVLARQDEVCNGTINKELGTLRTFHTHSKVSPKWELEKLSHDPAEKQVYSPDVIRRLWSELSDELRLAVGLCLFTGMRGEEAYKAEHSWVDGDELRIPRDATKVGPGGKTYLVPTLRELIPAGRPLREKLITLTENQIRDALYHACRTIDLMVLNKKDELVPAIKGVGLFRHHCVTYADENGWSEQDTQQVTRHTTGSQTGRYRHSHSILLKKRMLLDVEAHVFPERRATTAADTTQPEARPAVN